LVRRGFKVKSSPKSQAIKPNSPVTSNWPHLVQELALFAEQSQNETGETPYLIGHSLGGLLSSPMRASKHPETVCRRGPT
jgi:alpha-beta hydrolase superfamily lysophospholipase